MMRKKTVPMKEKTCKDEAKIENETRKPVTIHNLNVKTVTISLKKQIRSI